MYQLYQRVAPRAEDFPRLLDKMGESMAQDFDLTEEVRSLQVPTMIVAADADTHHRAITSRFSSCLTAASGTAAGWARGGRKATRSAILPGLTHYNLAVSPLFAGHARLPRRPATLTRLGSADVARFVRSVPCSCAASA